MTEQNKVSRVEITRIEVGVLENCRESLTGIAELAEDIKERGLLQPLLVWHRRMRKEPHVLADGREVWDRYILIGGNRRHAALSRIRDEDPDAHATVPVILFTGNEDDALFAQIAENLQREDLTAVDLANAMWRLKNRGFTQAEIARRLSKSQGWVSRLLKLREQAIPEVLKAVAKSELPVETALAISELGDAAQKKALDRFRDKRSASGARDANRDARENAGRPVRRSVGDLRARLELLNEARGGAPRDLALARAILAWALGTGDWPASLPQPDEQEDEQDAA